MKKALFAFLIYCIAPYALAQQCPVGSTNFNGQCLNNPAGVAVIAGQTGTGAGGKGGSITVQPGKPTGASTAEGDVTLFQDPSAPTVAFKCSQPTAGNTTTATCAFTNITVSGAGGGGGGGGGAVGLVTSVAARTAGFFNEPILSGLLTIDGATVTAGQTILITGQCNYAGNVYFTGGGTTLNIATGSICVAAGQTLTVPGATPSSYTITGYTSGTGGAGSIFTVGAACTAACGTVGSPVPATTNGFTQNGPYTAGAGAWAYAPNWTGTIALNTPIAYQIEFGSVFAGTNWFLNTGPGFGPIVIGTTNEVWDPFYASATPTALGGVEITDTGSPPKAVAYQTGAAGTPVVLDCASFTTVNGSLGDNGNAQGAAGPCETTDPQGHPPGSHVALPSVTGAGCSIAAAGFTGDNSGAITATGADVCTLHFANVFSYAGANQQPFCAVAGESATVLPYISTRPTASQVVFTTAAAGTFEYVCLN